MLGGSGSLLGELCYWPPGVRQPCERRIRESSASDSALKFSPAAYSPALIEVTMKFSIILMALVTTSAWADDMKQPRTLGNSSVLHVYYYAPKTLEVTYVDSYLFKDQNACENAISAALKIAMPYADEGDLVSAKCIAMNPSDGIAKPDKARVSPESTQS